MATGPLATEERLRAPRDRAPAIYAVHVSSRGRFRAPSPRPP